MSPVYLNPQHSSSTIPFLELKSDHQQQNLPTIMDYVHAHDHLTNSNNNYNYNYNYFPSSNLSNHPSSIDFLAMDYARCSQEKIVETLLSHDKHIAYPYDNRADKVEIIKSEKIPKKCKPTKLRIMQRTVAAGTTSTIKSKKMIRDRRVEQSKESKRTSRNEGNGIRMCTDCHTTTTPLWRSGPHGPKSLCNACGIRQRKARRAAAMAAEEQAKVEMETETVNSPMSSSTTFEPPKQAIVLVDDMMSSKIKLDHDKIHTLPLKKRCKTYYNDFWTYNTNDNNINNIDINRQNDENNHFEDYSSNSQRVFLKDDEEEGAILLMELSCGMS